MTPQDIEKRLDAAHKLLSGNTTGLTQFESIRTLLSGIDKDMDRSLAACSKAIRDIGRLKNGELIPVVAENLPEDTQQNKKKKKRILAFIRTWQQLHQEFHRVRKEVSKWDYRPGESEALSSNNISVIAKIASGIKGPFGFITLVATIAVIGSFWFMSSHKPPATNENTIQVLVINTHQVPLSQFHTAQGQECSGQKHYHAQTNFQVTALDGTVIPDPDWGGCGYGKVSDVRVDTASILLQ